jgi:glycosyltransferase involved in cell wall biosynthesis
VALPKQLSIYAQNVNTGGAKMLLHTLVEHILRDYSHVHVRVLVGSSLDFELRHPRLTLEVLPTVWSKVAAMWQKEEHVLYFGNLPPLRPSRAGIVYIHNAYLAASYTELWQDDRISLTARLKTMALRAYLEHFSQNVETVACQTPQMEKRLGSFLDNKIRLLPFYREVEKQPLPRQYDLCYVGLPSAHKNHERLLDALMLLSQRGVEASIALTIPDFPENQSLLKQLDELHKAGRIKVANYGMGPFELVQRIYNSSRALVYPSLKESFGLPIIEAVSLGLELLISELPYADDVVTGGARFDPTSVESIADCIERFLEHPETIPPVELRIQNTIDRIVQHLLLWD